ncbi:hypothetical protein NHX12_010877 [Muraenolepis orangiensis]|uniref:Uncharacterized protein n=1 Tax=Muraenolepis orangiensis TaxID=630683 RepID=A0A9Q0DF56_9TELE|nr:hypothetical protein NHX12_010877 [Muraenolepis orangiensis]
MNGDRASDLFALIFFSFQAADGVEKRHFRKIKNLIATLQEPDQGIAIPLCFPVFAQGRSLVQKIRDEVGWVCQKRALAAALALPALPAESALPALPAVRGEPEPGPEPEPEPKPKPKSKPKPKPKPDKNTGTQDQQGYHTKILQRYEIQCIKKK